MQPRHYQVAAVQAVYEHLQQYDDNPCVVLPTGAGKTIVIAMICRDVVQVWNGRVLVLSHVKELLAQSEQKIKALCPDLPVSLYSAGLGRRDASHDVVVAGIQSVYQKAEQLGHFDLVLIDEVHTVTDSGDGMYRTLLYDLQEINPDLRIVGLTATPYRMTTGEICTPDGILNKVCYEIGIKQLIREGYLCKLVGKSATNAIDTSKLKIVRGEYDEKQSAEAFDQHLDAAILEIVQRTAERKSVLVFCTGVEHAETVREQLVKFARTEAIYGHTDSELRDRYAREFRDGAIKYLVNVGVLTTGFDAPNIDAIVILRATASPGLYYQIVGRGLRIHPGKENCLVLDFGENIRRHGPVDMVRPKSRKPGEKQDREYLGRVCEQCGTVVPSDFLVCTDCGAQFASTERSRGGNLQSEAADDEPISGKPTITEHAVEKVTYKIHHKKGAEPGSPRTMLVTYQIGMAEWVSEWICVEHSGYALQKAEKWWSERCRFPMPENAVEAVTVAQHGLLMEPKAIKVKRTPGNQFPEIKGYEFSGQQPPPEQPIPCPDCGALNMRCIVRIPDYDPGSKIHHGKIVCGDCNRFWGWASGEYVQHYGYVGDPGVPLQGMLPYEFSEPTAGSHHYEADHDGIDYTPSDSTNTPEVPW